MVRLYFLKQKLLNFAHMIKIRNYHIKSRNL
jgi:hypothetical protein